MFSYVDALVVVNVFYCFSNYYFAGH